MRPSSSEEFRRDGKPGDGQAVYMALTYVTFYIISLRDAVMIVSLD